LNCSGSFVQRIAFGVIALGGGCGGVSQPGQDPAEDAAQAQHTSTADGMVAESTVASAPDSAVDARGDEPAVVEAALCSELRSAAGVPTRAPQAACCMPGVNCIGVMGSGKFLYCSGGVWGEAYDGPCFPRGPVIEAGPDGADAREGSDAKSGED